MPVTHREKTNSLKRNVTTELPMDIFAAFEAVCKKAGMSKSQYMRKLVEGVVEAKQGEQKDA